MAMRQMETTTADVGGMKFYIRPFPAFKAANLTGELASVLAPLLGVLAPLVTKEDNGGGLMDIDVKDAAEAMSGCSAISGDKLELLMKKLLLGGHIVVETPDEENGGVEGKVLDMDIANEVFCGEVQDMFVLCFHVIKLNFNGFFKRIAGQSGKAGSAEEEKTPRAIL